MHAGRSRAWWVFAQGAWMMVASGCVGNVSDGSRSDDVARSGGRGVSGGGGSRGSSASGGNGAPAPIADACQTIDPGPAPLRRLVRVQYNAVVDDLLGDATRPALALPPEEAGGSFGHDADGLGVSTLLARGYYEVANAVAARATAADRIARTVACDWLQAGEAKCARDFVATFGRRMFRRPIEPEERADLMAVFDGTRADGDFAPSIAAVIATMLQSPQFLYRIERGDGVAVAAGVVKPTQHEMATRLSFFLWGTTPDEALLAIADAGRLGSRDDVLAQAKRMLDDPRGRRTVAGFHRTLFRLDGLDGLQKPKEHYPKFFAGLGALLRRESEAFLDHVLWNGTGTVEELLTAPYSFMNAPLAAYYGASGPKGDAFERVALDPKQRAGILTQGALMAALTPGDHSDPTVRGVYVRRDLLCRPPPDVPADLVASGAIKPVAFDGTKTTRQVYEQHAKDPLCAACHRLMDPIGFALESIDGLGVWRTTDNGKPIDARGELTGDDLDPASRGAVDGPVALAKKLASSPDLRACQVDHWLSFAYARPMLPDRDRCTRARAEHAFASSGHKIPDLVLALTQTDAFLYRPAADR